MKNNWYVVLLLLLVSLTNVSLADTFNGSVYYSVNSRTNAATKSYLSPLDSCNKNTPLIAAQYPSCNVAAPFVNGPNACTWQLSGSGCTQSFRSANLYANNDCLPPSVRIGGNNAYIAPPLCSVSCGTSKVFNPATNQCENEAKTPIANSIGTCWPIKFASGNKVLTEQDYVFNSTSGPNITRYYNKQSGGVTSFGSAWLGKAAQRISAAELNTATGVKTIVTRPDGQRLLYVYNGSQWQTDADVTNILTELKGGNGARTGWTYVNDETGDVETYNVSGQLVTITNRAGIILSVQYNNSGASGPIASSLGLISNVSDPYGHSITYTYNNSNRISSMKDPAGGIYTYAYSTDGNKNLISVTYPDNTFKQYHYEDPNHPNALTGVTDENGSRYMTYTYDANGRAVNEISPNAGTNVNHYALSYNPGVSTTVTDPRGTVRTYNFTTILGVVKSTGTDQPAGAGCAASGSNLTYDANGNISSRTDFNGNKTTYVYDLSRNLETSRTEGLTAAGAATAATRTITTTWHSTWRLPLVVSEYNGASATGTPLRTITTAYDSKGNITSVTEADPVNSTSRTATTAYTYSTAVPGLVLTKVVDGPRTDVNDITTYNYYPHDATCTASTATPIIDPVTGLAPDNLGCRGQLSSVTNALNQTTTYDRYNHHGQVEQMTDVNGLVTTSTYDLRQRLLTRTVGTETTTLTYDNVGQVTQLNLPDSSQLSYTYDAAHRLTDIQDNLGNKIHYTLDAQGNRINEDITDSTNQLTKTLTRSYDALNRLQQVTGVE